MHLDLKIPKILNLYWGGGPLSYLQSLTVVSFKKCNPDWVINLYIPTVASTDTEWCLKMAYTGKDYFDNVIGKCNVIPFDFKSIGLDPQLPEVVKSDFLRWYLMYEFGGCWSDMDILYIRKFHDYLLGPRDTNFVFRGGYYSIGFFQAAPGLQLFKDIFSRAKKDLNLTNYQSIGSLLLGQMFPNFDILQKKYPDLQIGNLKMDVVYPYTSHNINDIFSVGELSALTLDTLGIHWYNGDRIAKRYQNAYDTIGINSNTRISKLISNFIEGSTV